MIIEIPVIYERWDRNAPVLVMQVGDIEDPQLSFFSRDISGSTGLSLEEFRQLVTLQFKPLEGPNRFEVFNDGDEKIEDVVSWITRTAIGTAEVADIKLYPAVVRDENNTSLHLRTGKTGGFEVVYVTSGEAILTFPEKVDPVAAGVYVASQERDDVKLTVGTLAIIPAPTANGWTQVGEGFEFRYICQPRWSSDFVVSALDLLDGKMTSKGKPPNP